MELNDFQDTLTTIRKGTAVAPKLKESEVKSKTAPIAQKSVVIANGTDGNWSGGGAYSTWAKGSFNLGGVGSMKFTFPSSQAGVKFVARLLPQGANPESKTGLNPKVYTIPRDGVVVIPMNEFPISGSDLKTVEQISIHSGTNAWGDIRFGQVEDKTAVFNKMEGISDKAQLSEPVGGIDMNPAIMQREIQKNGNGVIIPISPVLIDNFKVDGLLPIIINVSPVTNVMFLLGIVDQEPNEEESSKVSFNLSFLPMGFRKDLVGRELNL